MAKRKKLIKKRPVTPTFDAPIVPEEDKSEILLSGDELERRIENPRTAPSVKKPNPLSAILNKRVAQKAPLTPTFDAPEIQDTRPTKELGGVGLSGDFRNLQEKLEKRKPIVQDTRPTKEIGGVGLSGDFRNLQEKLNKKEVTGKPDEKSLFQRNTEATRRNMPEKGVAGAGKTEQKPEAADKDVVKGLPEKGKVAAKGGKEFRIPKVGKAGKVGGQPAIKAAAKKVEIAFPEAEAIKKIAKPDKSDPSPNRTLASILYATLPALIGSAFGGYEGGAAGAKIGSDAIGNLLKKDREDDVRNAKQDALKLQKVEDRNFDIEMKNVAARQADRVRKFNYEVDMVKDDRKASIEAKKLQQRVFEFEKNFEQSDRKMNKQLQVEQLKIAQRQAEFQQRIAIDKAKLTVTQQKARADIMKKSGLFDKTKTQSFKEAQNKAAKFARSAELGNQALNASMAKGFNPSTLVDQGKLLFPSLSADARAYQNAQHGFLNAVLRDESGAAVPESEYPRYIPVYFPMFNDSKEEVERKAGLRQDWINARKSLSGGAYDAILEGAVFNGIVDIGKQTAAEQRPIEQMEEDELDAEINALKQQGYK